MFYYIIAIIPKSTIKNIMKITKYFNMNPNIANIVMKKYLAINVNIAIPNIIKIIVNIMLIYLLVCTILLKLP